MPGEVKFTPYGIPYVVEFANVSIWPRPPMGPAAAGDPAGVMSPLTRSNTMPHLQTAKPLPSLPPPARSKSLKLFRTKTRTRSASEKGDADAVPERPVVRRNATLAMGARGAVYRHAKIFGSPSSTSLFSSSQETLVDLDAEPDLASDTQELDVPAGSEPTRATDPPLRDGLCSRSGGLYIQFPASSSSTATSATSLSQKNGAPCRKLHKLSRTIAKAVLAAGMDTPATVAKQEGKFEGDASKEDVTSVPGGGKDEALFKGTYGQVRAAFRAAGLVTMPCEEQGIADATRLGVLFVANRDGHGAVVFTKVVLWG